MKDIVVGSRIYIRKMIRKDKLESRFTGPLRVEGISSSTIFCYDLASGKSKQVTMTRCHHAEDISEIDNKKVNSVYPEE